MRDVLVWCTGAHESRTESSIRGERIHLEEDNRLGLVDSYRRYIDDNLPVKGNTTINNLAAEQTICRR